MIRPATMDTICFFILPFLLNVVTVIISSPWGGIPPLRKPSGVRKPHFWGLPLCLGALKWGFWGVARCSKPLLRKGCARRQCLSGFQSFPLLRMILESAGKAALVQFISLSGKSLYIKINSRLFSDSSNLYN